MPLLQLEGKYEILRKLHEGGMGDILLVRHKLLGEDRVIKSMRPSLAGDEQFRQRFLAEAKAAAQLKHPNIAQVHDFNVDEHDNAYIVLEYIPGASFKEVLETHGPPPLRLTLELARQALGVLVFLHGRGKVHRDISPDNLMLQVDHDGLPWVKLIDLGIVKDMENQGHLTTTGHFLGKVRYSSPEHFGELGAAGAEPRSDQYSFGLVLYELLTGRPAISGTDLASISAGHLYRAPLSFVESDPDKRIPDELRRLVMKTLQKRADDRYETTAELAEALGAVQKDYPLEGGFDVQGLVMQSIEARADRQGITAGNSTQARLDRQFGLETTPGVGSRSTASFVSDDLRTMAQQQVVKSFGSETADVDAGGSAEAGTPPSQDPPGKDQPPPVPAAPEAEAQDELATAEHRTETGAEATAGTPAESDLPPIDPAGATVRLDEEDLSDLREAIKRKQVASLSDTGTLVLGDVAKLAEEAHRQMQERSSAMPETGLDPEQEALLEGETATTALLPTLTDDSPLLQPPSPPADVPRSPVPAQPSREARSAGSFADEPLLETPLIESRFESEPSRPEPPRPEPPPESPPANWAEQPTLRPPETFVPELKPVEEEETSKRSTVEMDAYDESAEIPAPPAPPISTPQPDLDDKRDGQRDGARETSRHEQPTPIHDPEPAEESHPARREADAVADDELSSTAWSTKAQEPDDGPTASSVWDLPAQAPWHERWRNSAVSTWKDIREAAGPVLQEIRSEAGELWDTAKPYWTQYRLVIVGVAVALVAVIALVVALSGSDPAPPNDLANDGQTADPVEPDPPEVVEDLPLHPEVEQLDLCAGWLDSDCVAKQLARIDNDGLTLTKRGRALVEEIRGKYEAGEYGDSLAGEESEEDAEGETSGEFPNDPEVLAELMTRGLEEGPISDLRKGVEGFFELRKTEPDAVPEDLRESYLRGHEILKHYYEMWAAQNRSQNPMTVIEKASWLVENYPFYDRPEALRDEAAASVEQEARGHMEADEPEVALALLRSLSSVWPDRPGLAEQIAAIEQEQARDFAFEERLAEIRKTLDAKKPEQGLEMMRDLQIPANYTSQASSLRSELQGLLLKLDLNAPTVERVTGVRDDYKKKESAVLEVEIADDYGVISVAAYVRVSGEASFQEKPFPMRKEGASTYRVEVPPETHQGRDSVEIYIEARDRSGNVGRLGTADSPIVLKSTNAFRRMFSGDN